MITLFYLLFFCYNYYGDTMLETAKKVLKLIEDKGFRAYLVGGFVRDYILGIESADIDITTNATPKDMKDIFNNVIAPEVKYGSVTLLINNIRFEVTTFRKELNYVNNRKPLDVEYIDNLLEDLKRRDFTINTLCMDKDGNIIDLLNGRSDLEKKIIRAVGDPIDKFNEDSLRILRAIRFATVLDFTIEGNTKEAIKITKGNLATLSYNRKKQELDKIFVNSNAKYGIDLIIELGLAKLLELNNLEEIKLSNDIIGIWASLDVSSKYPFTNSEKELISKIKEVVTIRNQTNMVLYKYGLYVNSVAADILGKSKVDIIKRFEELPIRIRRDIDISSEEIRQLLNGNSGAIFKEIYNNLEKSILNGVLENNNDSIKEYIKSVYC